MQLPNSLKAPGLIQSLQFFRNPTGFLDKIAQKYPDIFSGKFFVGQNCVFVQHPQGIEEFFNNERKKFGLCDNPSVQTLIGPYALTSLMGVEHKRQRKLMIPCFHGERMQSYGQQICDLTEKTLSEIPLGQTFSTHALMEDISLQVMLKVVFGIDSGETYDKLRQLLPLNLKLLTSPFVLSMVFFPFIKRYLGAWTPWGKFLQIRQEVDELIYAQIASCRAQPDTGRTDVLSLLIEAKDDEGQSMTDRELRDQLITLLFGGHETTVAAMTWALYWTHYIPKAGEKLRQELDSISENAEAMSIFKLPYLTAICKESLRYYHPGLIIFPRVVQESVEILGHRLEPGTRLIACTYLLHHREDIYPQHQKFIPERFIDKQYSPYEFLPFGGGLRRCIGETLAMFEMKLVVATVISRYQLRLEEHLPVGAKFRGFTLGPATEVNMSLTQKRGIQKSLETVASNS